MLEIKFRLLNNVFSGFAMRLTLLPFFIASSVALIGCAGPSGVYMSADEANAPKKRMLENAEKYKQNVAVSEKESLWNQPVNKKEKCLLPIFESAKNDPSMKQFWDGGCKNGYAYGLGRDIMISDTMHMEEIVNHDFTKKTNYGPLVWRDYVNKRTTRAYKLGGYSGQDAMYSLTENPVQDRDGEIQIEYCLEYLNKNELTRYSKLWTSLSRNEETVSAYRTSAVEEGVSYWHDHKEPKSSAPFNFITDIWTCNESPMTATTWNVPYRLRYKNGIVQTLVMKNGSAQILNIMSMENHWQDLDRAMANAEKALHTASMAMDAVKNLEKSYLYKLKQKNTKVPTGLDPEKYYAILKYKTDASDGTDNNTEAISRYDKFMNATVAIVSSDGLGSGFHIKGDLIISNAHVVGNDSRVTVVYKDGKSITGTVIKKDKNKDLAAIRVKDLDKPVLRLDSDTAQGDNVIAIGTPKGLPWSVSKGIVSSFRDKDGVNYVQTDTPVNPGNSGGPLISTESGRVVGVVTFKLKDAENLNFAVSAKTLKGFISGLN